MRVCDALGFEHVSVGHSPKGGTDGPIPGRPQLWVPRLVCRLALGQPSPGFFWEEEGVVHRAENVNPARGGRTV